VTERKSRHRQGEGHEAKEKKARDPNAKPTFHDGIHIHKQQGDAKSLKGNQIYLG
jgi:hypothetical protein